MDWQLPFINESDLYEHVQNTIKHYGDKLVSYDIERFNRNLIDPIKMVFDRAVYGETWKGIIESEIFRQRDKSNTNEIGYFHQRIFQYMRNCHVPDNGADGGWDVILFLPDGYAVSSGNIVHKIYVEMKNKHNTMNSAAAGKTYIKMQNQLLHDDDCACFLVEAIAKRSQNTIWSTTVDSNKVSHTRIRRVSLDNFYSLVTGDSKAFFKVCMVLPEMVGRVLESSSEVTKLHDTVYEELLVQAKSFKDVPEEKAMLLSMYMLGFSSYEGFSSLVGNR